MPCGVRRCLDRSPWRAHDAMPVLQKCFANCCELRQLQNAVRARMTQLALSAAPWATVLEKTCRFVIRMSQQLCVDHALNSRGRRLFCNDHAAEETALLEWVVDTVGSLDMATHAVRESEL